MKYEELHPKMDYHNSDIASGETNVELFLSISKIANATQDICTRCESAADTPEVSKQWMDDTQNFCVSLFGQELAQFDHSELAAFCFASVIMGMRSMRWIG